MGTSAQRPIKVMHIIARMNVGGPAVEIAELMRGLDPNVVSQRLVTGFCDDDEADYLETQAPDVHATRVKGLGRSISPLDDALVLGRLVHLIRASRPDILHTHTAKAGALGRIAAKASGTGAKIVHTHHGHLLHGYFGPNKTRAVVGIERGLAQVTDRMIAVGERVKTDLLSAHVGTAAQYVVIRSGVVASPVPDQLTARAQLSIPEGIPVVAFVGRLAPIKRPDRLAEVMGHIRDMRPEALFLIAGWGEMASELRQSIEKYRLNARMLGWCSNVETVYAASDVYLLTSDNEGVPLTVLEASRSGVPVVSTRVGAVEEAVVDGRTGILTGTDSAEITSALMALLDDRDLCRWMGEQGRTLSEEQQSADAFLEGHRELYLSLL